MEKKIKDNWKEMTLGEVVEFQRGFDLPIQNRKIGEYPLVVSNGVDGFVSEYKVRGPGVITGRSGTLGKVLFVKDNFWPLNTTLWIKDFKGNDEKFIYYWLLNFPFEKYNAGSGVPTLNRNHIHEVLVCIPENKIEQQAIAAVLSSLDDKIELLREQNKTLEAIAQAIFKEWFVNFNFPRAAGKMVDSELGEIPGGWKIEKLGDIVNIVYGKNLPTTNLQADGFPVFGGNGQIGFFDKYLYKEQQILVSCRGEASGKVNISLPNSFVTNNSLILEIIEKSTINFNFLKFFSLNTDYTIYVSGSAQPQITIETIKYCPVLLPPKNILDLFNQAINPFTKKNLLNLSQIKTLSNLRDALLPKLMKGEVRVKEFDK